MPSVIDFTVQMGSWVVRVLRPNSSACLKTWTSDQSLHLSGCLVLVWVFCSGAFRCNETKITAKLNNVKDRLI